MARILLIEDDNDVREWLRQVLERVGYEVEEACNGDEGIERYREKQADLIITDIIMPKKEGIETITDLRVEFPDVKVIAISGGGRLGPEPYLELAKGFGANRIIMKPFTTAEILEAIQELLEQPSEGPR
ncbi:MAG: response regulator [Desulfobacteraceae bacterium]|nr:response regulator [Desulfobacteraceae bacterium]